MKVKIIAKRIIKQTINDKRTLALMLIAPLIILTLIFYLFNTVNDSKINIGTHNVDNSIVLLLKKNDNVNIINYQDNKDLKSKITKDNLAAFMDYTKDNYNITYENFDVTNTGKTKAIINSVFLKSKINTLSKSLNILSNNSFTIKKEIKTTNNYLYLDGNSTFFDIISPTLISFIVFFFVFLIAGISFLNERTTGTLERLLSTPIKRYQLVFGYFLGYALFAIIQTIIIVLYAIYILNTPLEGNIILVLITNVLTAFVALSLGLLLSSFASSEFQMVQFIPVVVIPQVFFMGIINVNTMHIVLQKIALFFPMYYAGHTQQNIMIKGFSLGDIYYNLLILITFIVVFSFLNIISLKKYREI